MTQVAIIGIRGFQDSLSVIIFIILVNILNPFFPESVKMINFVFCCRFPNFQNKQNIKLYWTTGTTSNYWCIVRSLVSLGILNKQTKAGPPRTTIISWSFEWNLQARV